MDKWDPIEAEKEYQRNHTAEGFREFVELVALRLRGKKLDEVLQMLFKLSSEKRRQWHRENSELIDPGNVRRLLMLYSPERRRWLRDSGSEMKAWVDGICGPEP